MRLETAALEHRRELERHNRAPGTIEKYGYVHTLFGRYLSEALGRAPTVADLTLDSARNYLLWLRREHTSVRKGGKRVGHSDSNIAYHATVLHRWGAVLAKEWDEMYPRGNPLERLEIPSFERVEPKPVPREQIELLLKLCPAVTPDEWRRNVAVILLCWDTGCRIGEVIALRLSDVELATTSRPGRVLVRAATVKGKRGRYVGLGLRASKAIRHYLDIERGDDSAPWLFVTRTKDQLTARTVRAALTKLDQAAGIDHVHPHRFRHSYGTQQAAMGTSTLLLTAQLGHTSSTMSAKYVHLSEIDIQRSYRSPADAATHAPPAADEPPENVIDIRPPRSERPAKAPTRTRYDKGGRLR